jgi:hypothetical protein
MLPKKPIEGLAIDVGSLSGSRNVPCTTVEDPLRVCCLEQIQKMPLRFHEAQLP